MNDSYFTPVDDQNLHVDRTCAKLLIYPGSMHPKDITALLRIEPTSTVAVGERKQPNSIGRTPVGEINGWFLSSEDFVRSKDLRSHLDWLIEKLKPSKSARRNLQSTEGIGMYVSCPWWSRTGIGAPSLWPKQMCALADLNLECTIEFSDYSEPHTV